MQYQKESVDQCQANLDLMVFDKMLESVSYASIFQVCMEHVYTVHQCPSRLIQSTYIGFQHVNSFWYINQSILWWNNIFKNENWNFNEKNDSVCVRILWVNNISYIYILNALEPIYQPKCFRTPLVISFVVSRVI